MNILLRLSAVALIFFGEVFSISAQLLASKRIEPGMAGQTAFLVWMFIAGALGGILLVAGYIIGYMKFQNIWVVTAISIGSIVIFEPILAAILFRQLPTFGAAVGLVLGVAAIFSAVYL